MDIETTIYSVCDIVLLITDVNIDRQNEQSSDNNRVIIRQYILWSMDAYKKTTLPPEEKKEGLN